MDDLPDDQLLGPTEKQMRYLHRYREALQADLDEPQKAYQVQAVHNELNMDQDFYKQLWLLMGSKERAAIKAYLAMSVEQPIMKPNGRA